MNLKVLMVCSQYPPVYGGAGQQASLLAEHLHRKGWRVTVVTLDQLSKGSSTDGGFKVKRVSCLSGRAGRLARGVSTIGLGRMDCSEGSPRRRPHSRIILVGHSPCSSRADAAEARSCKSDEGWRGRPTYGSRKARRSAACRDVVCARFSLGQQDRFLE